MKKESQRERTPLGEADTLIGVSPQWESHSAAEPESGLRAVSIGLWWVDRQVVDTVGEFHGVICHVAASVP